MFGIGNTNIAPAHSRKVKFRDQPASAYLFSKSTSDEYQTHVSVQERFKYTLFYLHHDGGKTYLLHHLKHDFVAILEPGCPILYDCQSNLQKHSKEVFNIVLV